MSRENRFNLPAAIACFAIALFFSPARLTAQTTPQATPKTPDVITFTNGDQLTGHLVQAIDGNVTFHSDIVGDITIPWVKIKSMKAQQQFAVIDQDERLTRKNAASKITLGPVAVEDNKITISPAAAPPKTFATNSSEYLVDAPTLNRELKDESDLLYGWTGNITLGASVVESTNTSQTYNGTVALQRTIPTVTWLRPVSRTSLNLSATYGLLTQPQILVGDDLIQAASSAKTNILHGDTEYDSYLSRRTFLLANASADHNFGSGLQLQQSYGLGFGWSAIKNKKTTLDLKTDLHYEEQQFYNGVVSGLGTPSLNLIVADFTEIYTYTFFHGVKFNENLTFTPAFNVFQASSALVNAGIVFPVYKKLNFTLNSTDNYLGDPPAGYQRNTFQLNAGITYVIK